jgi:hypothetical protein
MVRFFMADDADEALNEKAGKRELTLEELDDVIVRHQRWLCTDRKGNEDRADLKNTDLRKFDLNSRELASAQFQDAVLDGVHLQNAGLVGANFDHATLKGAKLGEADLGGAYMGDADLRAADLDNTKLRGAKLRNANLTGTTGLLAEQLGDTNLTGAKLPEEIGKFAGLQQAAELSTNAKTTFIGMLAACAYSWLAVGMTTDLSLALNSAYPSGEDRGVSVRPLISQSTSFAFSSRAGPWRRCAD